MRIKSIFIFIIGFAIIVQVVVSSVHQVQSYMIGIAQNIPGKVQGLENYQKQLRHSQSILRSGIADDVNDRKGPPTYGSWEEYRKERFVELAYEINFLSVAIKIAKYLDDKNMVS